MFLASLSAVAAIATAPTGAAACSIDLPLSGRWANAQEARYLVKTSRVVRGAWRQTWESPDRRTVAGEIEFTAWGRHKVAAVAAREPGCEFPNPPVRPTDEGEFYLKKLADGSYRILHFVPDRWSPRPPP